MENVGITQEIQGAVALALKASFDFDVDANTIIVNQTKKEFEGDYTVVLFPFVKRLKTNPKVLGDTLTEELMKDSDLVRSGSVVSGFLNLSLQNKAWLQALQNIQTQSNFGAQTAQGKKIMVEYSSPNTNKPLHLGHIRNILLGHSCSMIYEALGYEVIQTQVINDRGIAVCKSMYAWDRLAEGSTPESTNSKGDHFVGKFYVAYNTLLTEEYNNWQSSDEAEKIFASKAKDEISKEDFFKKYKNVYFNENSSIGADTKKLLLAWEAGEKETVALWEKLNTWVYAGFNATYEKLGVKFTKNYYESDTYKLGKKSLDQFLEKGLFTKDDDGSVWIDLSDIGMDRKLLLRSDGTSVYMTQDLGTAQKRFEDFGTEQMVYVVGDEQDYHFKVLFEILKRMGEPYAKGLYHLSYGMIDLPTGKMKSREGTVVDADDLIEEVIAEARNSANERGGLEEFTAEEKNEIFKKVGLGALKYQIIKINPRKRMIFDPKESVDMQGTTGPYIQNAFVRIQSILNKIGAKTTDLVGLDYSLNDEEKELLILMGSYPEVVKDAAKNFDPSLIANFSYQLAKVFHRFYHEHSILKAGSEAAQIFRTQLSHEVANVIEKSMKLLGIDMPQRM